jgi:hypothetical protein
MNKGEMSVTCSTHREENSQSILVGKPEGKRRLGNSEHGCNSV